MRSRVTIEMQGEDPEVDPERLYRGLPISRGGVKLKHRRRERNVDRRDDRIHTMCDRDACRNDERRRDRRDWMRIRRGHQARQAMAEQIVSRRALLG